jgi:hypothetical protein
LALALRQVLPVGYNFSIDQNIDMDTLVSYKGGKPWRDTVQDMLTAANLTARERGSTVTVSRASASAAPVATTTRTAAASLLPAAMPLDGDNASAMSAVSISPQSTVAVSSHSAPAASYLHAPDNIPSVNVGSGDGWSAERGDTLRKVLADWCKRSGVELQWLAEYDYPMEATAHFSGSFEDAVRLLLAGFESARPQPIAELHTNATAGQMLLVVQTRGNNYTN